MRLTVVRRRSGRELLMFAAAALTLVGCRSDRDSDAKSSGDNDATTQPAPLVIVPESHDWSREEARKRLGDERLGVSAAVRLVRLAEISPLCVPQEMNEEFASRLRLAPLRAGRWVLGLVERSDENSLRAAVLVTAESEVRPVAEGAEEELLVVHVSQNADMFPHVAVLPHRVSVIEDDICPAIVLEPNQPARFERRVLRGINYIALLALGATEDEEAAVYEWDIYERAFVGPAIDKLPDPPGGRFHVDLEASRRLVPIGGEVPEPEPPPPPVTDEPPKRNVIPPQGRLDPA